MKDMSRIKIHRYEEKYRDEWENFVDESNNGTMFHKMAFLDYHSPGKFQFDHLMFRRGDELMAVLPGGLKNENTVFWSPVGASYGSIVTKDLAFTDSLEIVDAFIDYCKEINLTDAYLIPPPIIYSDNISQHLEYAMLYRKCDFELHYISHAIDLKFGLNTPKYYDKTARKTVNKILRENKITIRESDDYETFNKILLINKAKHNAKPTHSLEDMIRIAKLMPQNVRLNMVYHEDTPIAGSWLFFANKNVVLCFYNMLLYEYEHLKPVYLINHETVVSAVEEGYKWVDIGVSQDTSAADPMTPSTNLIYFKERFFARGILRSTFHFNLNK